MQTTAAQNGNICPLCDYWMFVFVFVCTFWAHQFRRKYMQKQVGAHMLPNTRITNTYLGLCMCQVYNNLWEFKAFNCEHIASSHSTYIFLLFYLYSNKQSDDCSTNYDLVTADFWQPAVDLLAWISAIRQLTLNMPMCLRLNFNGILLHFVDFGIVFSDQLLVLHFAFCAVTVFVLLLILFSLLMLPASVWTCGTFVFVG